MKLPWFWYLCQANCQFSWESKGPNECYVSSPGHERRALSWEVLSHPLSLKNPLYKAPYVSKGEKPWHWGRVASEPLRKYPWKWRFTWDMEPDGWFHFLVKGCFNGMMHQNLCLGHLGAMDFWKSTQKKQHPFPNLGSSGLEGETSQLANFWVAKCWATLEFVSIC